MSNAQPLATEDEIPTGPTARSVSAGRAGLHAFRFRLLLASLLLLLLASPYLEQRAHPELALHVLAAGVLVAGVVAVSARARVVAGVAALAAVAFAADLAAASGAGDPIPLLAMAAEAAFQLVITAAVFHAVFASARVSIDTLAGSVCVYLLVGFAFAALYGVVEALDPGAFHLPDPAPVGLQLWSNLVYLSFATLTTLGYGDITPASAAARSLTMLQAIVGVLYVAVLVARLVSIYESDRARSAAQA